MGAFSNMDYELQNSEATVSDAFTEDDAMDMPQAAPVEPATASSPTAAPTPAAAVSEPANRPLTPKVRMRPAVRTKRPKPSAKKSGTPNRRKAAGGTGCAGKVGCHEPG